MTSLPDWAAPIAARDEQWARLLSIPADASLEPAGVWDDPAWWEARLADTARRWGSKDRKVNATLWWFAASHAWARLIAVPLLWQDRTVAWESTEGVWLRSYGYLGGPRCVTEITRAEAAAALDRAWRTMTVPLHQASGVPPQTLMALAGDSLVGTLLEVSARGLGQAGGSALASQLIGELGSLGTTMPRRTFLDVSSGGHCLTAGPEDPVAAGHRRVSPRTSCCRIYQTPTHRPDQRCPSCPRRDAADRLARWAERVSEP